MTTHTHIDELKLDTIYCMDCIEGMKKIEDNSIDLVVTSPPYNINMTRGDMWGKKKKGKKLEYGNYKDNLKQNEYEEWQKNILRECYRIIKPSGAIFYNHKPRIQNKKYDNKYGLFPFLPRQEIIWDRGTGLNFNYSFFVQTIEKIFLFAKKDFKINKGFAKYGEVWRFPPDFNNKNHPASFPLELPIKCIKSATQKGDIVLDPFMGSGTTAIACKMLNRHFIGFEINQEYVNIANKRLTNIPSRKLENYA